MAETLSKRSDGISAQQAAAILARREALHEWPVRLLATLNCIAIVALPWWAISSTNVRARGRPQGTITHIGLPKPRD